MIGLCQKVPRNISTNTEDFKVKIFLSKSKSQPREKRSERQIRSLKVIKWMNRMM